MAEPFLQESRDLNLAVRTYPSLQLSAIERPERKGSGGIYSYAQKYLAPGGAGLVSSPHELPAHIPDELAGRIRQMAGTVAALFAARSVARIDFLERGGEVWVNEINTIPGSLSVYLWIDPPLGWAGLLAGLIAEARGSRRVFSAVGSDGAALRGAASVAAKLGGAARPAEAPGGAVIDRHRPRPYGKAGATMRGWTDGEMADRSLMAPCGLYCGVCGVYIATRDGDDKFRQCWAVCTGRPPNRPGAWGACRPIRRRCSTPIAGRAGSGSACWAGASPPVRPAMSGPAASSTASRWPPAAG